MPVVHVYVWRGFTAEAKRKVVTEITKVFTDLGIPPHAVEVIIHEVPKENWGVSGELASDKFKDLQPP